MNDGPDHPHAARGTNGSGETHDPLIWPEFFIPIWDRLDPAAQSLLMGPWSDDPFANHRATTSMCIDVLRQQKLGTGQMTEVASVFPEGFGFLRHYFGGVGKLIQELRDELDTEAEAEQEVEQFPILSLAEFMATYETPDYVVDGILQRGRLYALTSPTSHGKTAVAQCIGIHVPAKRNLGNIEVSGGPIIFLAGENPSDLCVRMHAACQYHGLNPAKVPFHVMPGNFPLTPEAAEELRGRIDAKGIKPAGIIFDTAASFFPGDNDNDNVQKGAYGRNLRVLTTCQGRPFVVVPTHPVKHPDRDNLIPAGGGAFMNELDGNLTLWGDPVGEIATLHWQGKFRGADFQPVTFALQQVKIAGLIDAKGRHVVSIIATLQTYDQAEAAARTARGDEDTVLELLRRHPGISIRAMCTEASWVTSAGSPLVSKVQRLIKSLKADKLVAMHRGKYRLTEAGKKEVSAE
jgi:hypothetical protein